MSDTAFDVITWGETMLRLSSPRGVALESATVLDVAIGGTESNLAIALARLGKRVSWVSRLPDNPIGRRIAREIGSHGVDTSHVIWCDGDEKAGLYLIEPGAAPRSNRVIYERKGSAISLLEPQALDYGFLASGSLLHLTGVTPALAPGCREAWLASARKARAAGCKVTLDVNYRAKLWPVAAARETLEAAFPFVEVLFSGLGDLCDLFGLPKAPEPALKSFAAAYRLPLVVVTLGSDGAIAYEREKDTVRRYPVFPTEVQDRIGAGDAFAAGFLYGWLERDVPYGLLCGNAMAALKQTYRGDSTWATREDLLELVERGAVDPRRVDR